MKENELQDNKIRGGGWPNNKEEEKEGGNERTAISWLWGNSWWRQRWERERERKWRRRNGERERTETKGKSRWIKGTRTGRMKWGDKRPGEDGKVWGLTFPLPSDRSPQRHRDGRFTDAPKRKLRFKWENNIGKLLSYHYYRNIDTVTDIF